MTMPGLECVRVAPRWAEPLAEFFMSITRCGDDVLFRPHPLTAEYAAAVCGYEGRDLYYVMVNDGRVLAYGMLRGWDEGYAVPSLGIAVRPSSRGTGIASALMLLLHAAAKHRGAATLRLTVQATNAQAISVYRRLGYAFSDYGEGRLVGTLKL